MHIEVEVDVLLAVHFSDRRIAPVRIDSETRIEPLDRGAISLTFFGEIRGESIEYDVN